MSTVVVIGEPNALRGYALAGASVVDATTAAEARAAWDGLADDVGLLILSRAAADALADALGDRPDVLTAVMP